MTSLWQRISTWWREATGAAEGISPHGLAERLQRREQVFVLDVRTTQEFKQDGHIAGATLITLAELPAKLKKVPTDRPVVCVCRSGARSSSACRVLQQAGYTQVLNLNGGMMGWQAARLPVTRK